MTHHNIDRPSFSFGDKIVQGQDVEKNVQEQANEQDTKGNDKTIKRKFLDHTMGGDPPIG